MKHAVLLSALGKVSGHFVAVVYLVLGLGDLIMSLAAFRLGVAEGNPVLAFMVVHGLFVPAKLIFTVLAAGLIVTLYSRSRVQLICWSVLILMALVDVYHVVSLSARLQLGC
jgi:hypothetical protein